MRLGLALGDDVSAFVVVAYEALLRREVTTENASENEVFRLHSVVSSTIGIGYAF